MVGCQTIYVRQGSGTNILLAAKYCAANHEYQRDCAFVISKGLEDGPELSGLIVIVNAAVTSRSCAMGVKLAQLHDATNPNIVIFLQDAENYMLVELDTSMLTFAKRI